MKKRIYFLFAIFLAVTLVSCNLPGTQTGTGDGNLETQVAGTLQAMTAAAPLTTPTDSTAALTQPTDTATPEGTPILKPGSIEGTISGYPYGDIPRLAIVAIGQEPPYNYSYWIAAAGSTYFNMSSDYLLPGFYQVVAYDSSGHAGGCPGGVTVKAEETVTCNISDWSGGYPSKPAGVPNP